MGKHGTGRGTAYHVKQSIVAFCIDTIFKIDIALNRQNRFHNTRYGC